MLKDFTVSKILFLERKGILMKKFMALILALLMVGATMAGCAPASEGGEESGENVIRIGVFEPLTGDSASGGKK